MKLVTIFVLSIILSGCLMHEAEHVRLAEKISFKYSKLAYENDDLFLDGYGGGMMGDIHRISLSFDSVRQPDISQARKLLVAKVEEFLMMVNSDCNIRPFLHTYPFDEKNVEFDIGFTKAQGGFVDPPYVAHVFIKSGIVYYGVYDCEKKRIKDLHEEPYSEAYKIVNETYSAILM